MKAFFFFFFLSLLTPSFADTALVSPVGDRLSFSELLKEEQSTKIQPDQTVLRYFLWEAYTLTGQIHQAQTYLVAAAADCSVWEIEDFASIAKEKRGRAAAVCALVHLEEVTRATPLFQFSIDDQILKDLATLEKEKLDPLEMLWFQTRFYPRRPPALGQDFKKGFVALESLQRMAPHLESIGFFRGEARLLQGHRNLTEEAFSEDKSPRKELLKGDYRRLIDGEVYGIRPRIFARPDSGFGVSLRFFDERAFDTATHFAVEGAVGWNAYYLGRGYVRIPMGNARLDLEGEAIWKREDHYGIGNSTSANAKSWVQKQRLRVDLGEKYFLTNEWALYAGASLQEEESQGYTFHLGPKLGIEWDTRDSAFAPVHGWNARAEWNSYWQILGSTFDTQIVTVQVQKSTSLSLNWTNQTGFCASSVFGRASYSTLRQSGDTCPTPGNRLSRFKDRALDSLWNEIDYRVWGPITIGAFGSLGSVGASVEDLFSQPLHPGGGTSLEWRFSRFHRSGIRLEAAVHGGEFLTSVRIGATI